MSACGDEKAPPFAAAGDTRRWREPRLLLAVCTLLLLAAALLLGQHTTSLGQLKGDLADGRARTVEIAGGMPPTATGYATVELRWRDGLFWHGASVRQVHGIGVPLDAAEQADASATVTGDVASQLREVNPQVHIVESTTPRFTGTIFGWQVPGWMAVTALALFLAALGLLISGPQPWRATRWAWFWLMVSPLGTLAYLLLSGPTPFIPSPRNPGRRLTGGWAFLLSLPVGALLTR